MRDSVTCVFVHGWAMNSAVWDECVNSLPGWINVVVVDLPGHGTMVDVPAVSLDDYVQALIPLVHQPVIWVGWSLGGLVVLRLAELYPQRVAAALLVATNPCFVRQPDWPCAVETEVFDQFSRDLNQNQEKIIRRFLALQVKGLPGAMNVVRQLQKSIQSRGQASTQALVSGLNILLEADLCQNISLIE
ncbi:MAG: alpha/beta fold hydrolase, partial [Gammaproteobacteria bacterium]|nr:alpha/beta fold hydrolase [Gammaproteobacteria bacterium]